MKQKLQAVKNLFNIQYFATLPLKAYNKQCTLIHSHIS